MLNANQGLPLVFPQGQPSTGGGRSRPHADEDLHYEPTDEEEEKQKKKQEMPKSPRLSSSARRRKEGEGSNKVKGHQNLKNQLMLKINIVLRSQ